MLQLLNERTCHNPWREFDLLQRSLNQWLPYAFSSLREIETIPINVFANDEAVKVVARMPGWQADWFDLTVEGNRLHLKGETKTEKGSGEPKTLSRTINLPFQAQTDKVQANYQNGILTVDLLKSKQDRPRKIQIETV